MVHEIESFRQFYKDGTFQEHVQEEYLVKGQFDIPYLSRKLGIPMSKTKGIVVIKDTFGTTVFNTPEVKNEVSKTVFDAYYEFGKFPDVRAWISEIYSRTGLVLTKAKLYEYILQSR